jgi:hypothetical protein
MRAIRVLVAYGSRHGATGEIADWIGDELHHERFVVDVLPASQEANGPSLRDSTRQTRDCTSSRPSSRQATNTSGSGIAAGSVFTAMWTSST